MLAYSAPDGLFGLCTDHLGVLTCEPHPTGAPSCVGRPTVGSRATSAPSLGGKKLFSRAQQRYEEPERKFALRERMELIRSNRTEALADALAAKVRTLRLVPSKNVVVVQSRGMERWLMLGLRQSASMSGPTPGFRFPRALIEWVLGEGSMPVSGRRQRGYDRARMRWTVAELLLQAPPTDLASHLSAPRTYRLLDLDRLDVDEYVMYRPDLLDRWVKGEDTPGRPTSGVGSSTSSGPGSRISTRGWSSSSAEANGALWLSRLHLFSLETLLLRARRACEGYPDDGLLARALQSIPRRRPDEWSAHRLRRGSKTAMDSSTSDALFARLPAASAISVSRVPAATCSPNRGARRCCSRCSRTSSSSRAHRLEQSDRSSTQAIRRSRFMHDRPHARGPGAARSRARRARRGRGPSPGRHRRHDADLDTYAPVFRGLWRAGRHPIPYEIHDRMSREDASFYDDFLAILEVLTRASLFSMWCASWIRAPSARAFGSIKTNAHG